MIFAWIGLIAVAILVMTGGLLLWRHPRARRLVAGLAALHAAAKELTGKGDASECQKALNTEVAWLTQMPTSERTKVLAHVVHQLTVATRCLVLSEGTDTVRLERIRQLNEAQH